MHLKVAEAHICTGKWQRSEGWMLSADSGSGVPPAALQYDKGALWETAAWHWVRPLSLEHGLHTVLTCTVQFNFTPNSKAFQLAKSKTAMQGAPKQSEWGKWEEFLKSVFPRWPRLFFHVDTPRKSKSVARTWTQHLHPKATSQQGNPSSHKTKRELKVQKQNSFKVTFSTKHHLGYINKEQLRST